MPEDWGLFNSDLESEIKKMSVWKVNSWELVIADLRSDNQGSLEPAVYREVLEDIEGTISVGLLNDEKKLDRSLEYNLNCLLLELSTYSDEYEKSLAYINKLIGLKPFEIDLYFVKSYILKIKSDFEGAHQVLETAWSLEPQNYEVNLRIVEDYAERKKYGEAADFIFSSRLEEKEKLKLLDFLDRSRDG